jgi:CheY-like chemotaxis protein/HPt (histidine-containing phosphotransfer) domain-containing protein
MKNSATAGNLRQIRARNGSPPRVLIAEDSLAARILTAALLRRMGCDVDEAEHGEEALHAAIACDYDVIILDIEMPVMDGLAAAAAIRDLGGDKGATPLVALSAFLADSAQSRHWLSLFDLTHAKPASREGLRRAVEAMLELNKREPEITPAIAAAPAMVIAPDSLIDRAAIEQMQQQFPADDWQMLMNSAVGEMLDSFEAITHALALADTAAILSHSHRVKGLARTFAAPRLATTAELLEIRAGKPVAQSGLDSGVEDLRNCLNRTVSELRMLSAA